MTADSLAAFLLARWDELWWVAEHSASFRGSDLVQRDNYGCLTIQPAYVLADIEAKRRIVETYQRSCDFKAAHGGDQFPSPTWATLQAVVTMLVQPFANHPDFRPEWKQ